MDCYSRNSRQITSGRVQLTSSCFFHARDSGSSVGMIGVSNHVLRFQKSFLCSGLFCESQMSESLRSVPCYTGTPHLYLSQCLSGLEVCSTGGAVLLMYQQKRAGIQRYGIFPTHSSMLKKWQVQTTLQRPTFLSSRSQIQI